MAEVFIYRAPGNRGAKDVSLHRERDWFTGISFLDYPYGIDPIVFRISVLERAGYIVVRDGTLPAKTLPFFGATLYIEPNSGENWSYPEGHHTIYHPDRAYWDTWHRADFANVNTSNVSAQLQSFYDLRER